MSGRSIKITVADTGIGLTAAARDARMLVPHDVVRISRGVDALARLLTEPTFDVVLCDMLMPGVSAMDVFADAVAHRTPGPRHEVDPWQLSSAP